MAVDKFSPTQDELDFMEYAAEAPDEGKMQIPWYKSYPAAAVRAITKGVIGVGEMMSGGEMDPRKRVESKKNLEQFLNEYLPIGDSFGPNAIERGGKSAIESLPFPAGGPLQTAIRSFFGGAAAEGAKQLGAPDWLQTGIEVGTQVAPDLRRSLINRLPTAAGRAERNLIEEARRLGLTEEELALALNQRGITKDFFQEISSKGGRTARRFDRTRQALGRVWDNLRGSPEATIALNNDQRQQLITSLSDRISQLPANQRNLIAQDFQDLLSSQMTGNDLINFWQDLNYNIHRGEGALGNLKSYLQQALYQISPELGRDFRITNELYGNFHRLAERMGPNIAESLIKAGENGIITTAITTGNFPLLKKVLSAIGARQLATELTTNPRFMNLSSRFISSLERRLPQASKKIYDQMLVEIGKINAEAASKMSGLDIDEFFESLDNSEED